MFEFYYQTGEFTGEAGGLLDFLKNLIVQIAGTAIGAWAAISLYKTQKNDVQQKQNREKEQQDLDNATYLFYLIEKSIECVIVYASQYKNFIIEMEKSMIDLPPLTLTRSMKEFDRLVTKTDLKDYYHSYRNVLKRFGMHESTSTFSRGISILSLLNDKMKQDIKILNSYVRKNEQSVDLLQKNIGILFFETEQYIRSNENVEIAKKLIYAKDNCVKMQKDVSGAEYEKFHKNYFQDVLSALERSGPSELGHSILRVSVESVAEYNFIEARKSELKKYVDEIVKTLEYNSSKAKSDFANLYNIVKTHEFQVDK